MDVRQEVERLKALLKTQAEIGDELDRKVFHLKTLYDVSKDIHGIVEPETILRNFLLMTMGNFGAYRGFILLLDTASSQVLHFVNLGFREDDTNLMRSAVRCLSEHAESQKEGGDKQRVLQQTSLPASVLISIPFAVEAPVLGLMGLGTKLLGDVYSEGDRELIVTLVNNLVGALQNAKSFQEIQRLNLDLSAKNIELEKTLKQLKASLRKIEILESVKANLSKFVPSTVTRFMDKSPTGAIPELQERDLSVLFLDIEGYTGLLERLGSSQVHSIIESHFSAFMDAIYANNGDVNETAGDGLMVLFLNEDRETNALDAVRTAIAIRERAVEIKKQFSELYRPLDTNMGINSGTALVGAAKFESLTGSRWTYTARGTLTNVAARISALGTKGSLLVSRETADRISGHYTPVSRGKFQFKNVSEKVEVFEL
jgi:class 3 adenylate cyclase